MKDIPDVGKIIENRSLARRDAIHVAVAPVEAGEDLLPGTHVGVVGGVCSASAEDKIGIVDPFLAKSVKSGESFWLFLYPNTITSLRHVWTHPAFVVEIPQKTERK